MKIIKEKVIIEDDLDGEKILKSIEKAGRTCYKSEDKITKDSAVKFVKMIVKSGHESVLEHEKITVRFICDRGISHQIVRHRVASYSQESTRYCNYSGKKFGEEITVIKPCFWNKEKDKEKYNIWKESMKIAEDAYFDLIKKGAKPEEARNILPTSLKTEIVMTANLREWRHFFRMRTSKRAHPQIRILAIDLLKKLKKKLPAVFEDIKI